MAGARAYECVYCHDLDRSHAINDVTKKKKHDMTQRGVGGGGRGAAIEPDLRAGMADRNWIK